MTACKFKRTPYGYYSVVIAYVIKNVHLYQRIAFARVVRSRTRSRQGLDKVSALLLKVLKTTAQIRNSGELQLQNEWFDDDNGGEDDVDEGYIGTSDVESDGDHHSVTSNAAEANSTGSGSSVITDAAARTRKKRGSVQEMGGGKKEIASFRPDGRGAAAYLTAGRFRRQRLRYTLLVTSPW